MALRRSGTRSRCALSVASVTNRGADHSCASSLEQTSAGRWGSSPTSGNSKLAFILAGPRCIFRETQSSVTKALCHPLANTSLLIPPFEVSMSTRSSAPLLPRRLASRFGGTRWPLFCSLLDTRSLGMRHLSFSRPSSFSPGLHGFALASSSGSKSQLHVAWCSGKLTKSVLEDYGGSSAASIYFAGKVSLLDLHGCRSSSSLATSTSSLQASSSSCGPLHAPLVALPPRGDVSDGCGVTPVVSSGLVHARHSV